MAKFSLHRADIALVAAQILFGLNYLSSKIVLGYLPPNLWAALRCSTAALMLVMIASSAGGPRPQLDRDFFKQLIPLTLLGTTLNQLFFLKGLQFTTASNSAVLCTLIPIFALFFIGLTGREKLSLKQWFAFGLAMVGAGMLIGVDKLEVSAATWRGDLMIIFNCACYGAYLCFSGPFLRRYDRKWLTAWMFCLASLVLISVAIPSLLEFTWTRPSSSVVGHALFAIVGGTVGTYSLVNYALAYRPASRVAALIYLQPVVATAASIYYLDERVTARSAFAAALIFFSVAISAKRSSVPASAVVSG